MSQAGILDVESSNPQIATSYDTDSGTAIPVLNVLEILGTGGIVTSGSGNTVTVDGSGIISDVDITGDQGTITGNALTIYTNNAINNSGATVKFVNSGVVSTLDLTDSLNNTFLGKLNGNATLTGASNTGSGYGTLSVLTTGTWNTSHGVSSLSSLTEGIYNVAVGYASGINLVTGSENILLGSSTGLSYTGAETGNILIGNDTRGVVGESYVTRIGNFGNAGSTPQSACFIDGIAGVTTSNSEFVTIDTTTGQLGSVAPSGVTSVTATNASIDFILTGSVEDIDFGVNNLVLGSPIASLTTGTNNVGLGSQALFAVTSAEQNVSVGTQTLVMLATGAANTALGHASQVANETGSSNTSAGQNSLFSNVSGGNNTAFGAGALQSYMASNSTAFGYLASRDVTGDGNTSVGFIALVNGSTGVNNTAIGYQALTGISTGNNNTTIGYNAGASLSSSDTNNIIVGANILGTAGDSNITRIGDTQTSCYVAGINGATVTGTAVLCATDGQLGTVVSSQRYKENIVDMPNDVSVLKLRPVKFNYKSDESKSTQYGLIAEEVDKDFPYLCFYKDNQPESVKYHELCVFLLAEIQRLEARITKLEVI